MCKFFQVKAIVFLSVFFYQKIPEGWVAFKEITLDQIVCVVDPKYLSSQISH